MAEAEKEEDLESEGKEDDDAEGVRRGVGPA